MIYIQVETSNLRLFCSNFGHMPFAKNIYQTIYYHHNYF